MIPRLTTIPLLLLAAIGPAHAADPFANPVKDCHPCRFSPGPGQPEFDLTFVFQGTGDQKALTALDIAPADGGPAQRLDLDPLAVADFADGFQLDTSDMNFDGLRDLSIVTQVAADNTNAVYWVYQPDSHRFAPLRRVNDDDSETVLTPTQTHELVSHVRGSAVEYTDYFYRVTGDRAVAVRQDSQALDGKLVVDASYDLTVQPPRLVRRSVIGFAGDSPERTAFVRQLDAASKRAAALYRQGDRTGAVAAVQSVLQQRQLALIVSAYPFQGDPGDATLIREFNDYGFYLEQAGQPKQAVDVLSQVTDDDPGRTVAYLNLADAQFAAGQKADARTSYAEYRKRMAAAGKAAEVPARVAERLR